MTWVVKRAGVRLISLCSSLMRFSVSATADSVSRIPLELAGFLHQDFLLEFGIAGVLSQVVARKLLFRALDLLMVVLRLLMGENRTRRQAD